MKMKRSGPGHATLLAGALLVATGCGGAAQTVSDAGLRIGVSMRVEDLSTRDALVSPVAHSARGWSQVGGSVSQGSAPWFHEVEVWYGSMPTRSGAEGPPANEGSQVTLASVSYGGLRSLGDSSWRAGLILGMDITHNEYEFGNGGAEAFLYTAGLDGAIRRTDPVGRRSVVEVTVRLPLLVWAARPDYSTIDESRLQADGDLFHRFGRGGWAGPSEFRSISGRVEHRATLSRSMGFRSGLTLTYSRHGANAETGRIRVARLGFDFGLTLNIGGTR